MPRTGEGKVLHVGVGDGEVANRVVTVGTAERAAVLAAHLDGAGGQDPKGRAVPGVFYRASDRGFTTYTGTVGGVAVSIISIGMGMAMMDFAVREVRCVGVWEPPPPLFLSAWLAASALICKSARRCGRWCRGRCSWCGSARAARCGPTCRWAPSSWLPWVR
jgi:hypothetical protein